MIVLPRKTRLIKLDRDEAVVETVLARYGYAYVVRVPRDVGELFRGARVIATIRKASDKVENHEKGSSNYISGDEFVKCVDECSGLTGREGDECVKKCLGVM